jgi:hypothetical protein
MLVPRFGIVAGATPLIVTLEVSPSWLKSTIVEKLVPTWHCAQLVYVPGPGCANVTVFEVIEVPLAQPANVTTAGAAAAPSQFGAAAVPVPGQEWPVPQSWLPAAVEKAL